MIEEQIALEKEMLDNGIARYHRIKTTAEENGRASETTYGQRLLPSLCVDLADAIEAAKNPVRRAGRGHKYLALLRGIDSNQAAFLTLRVIFDSLILGSTLANLSITLGQRVEDQVRFSRFEDDHEKFYRRVMEDFKRKGTTQYRHMHRVLVKKAREMEDEWVDWTQPERMLLGAKLIELTILSTGIIQKVIRRKGAKKSIAYVEATPDALEWIEDHVRNAELLHPEVSPCYVPPLDWTGIDSGGYYTLGIKRRVPFVKTRSSVHRKAIEDGDFTEPMAAINILQKTAWRVNSRVHKVMKDVWSRNLRIGMPESEPLEIPECPISKDIDISSLPEESLIVAKFKGWKRAAALTYTKERERIAKSIQLSRVFSMADKYTKRDEFYYVYTCDFRGRIYAASPGLSPQGADFSKGLLEFAKGKELGNEGAYWLAVHGSNVFGYDKDTYDGRNEWVRINEQAICAVAADPLGSEERSFWGNADKPYQFLAFCFEWADYLREGNLFQSRLAVALDGSCNGLQNFSAMLRDSVGGNATNLLPSVKPQDIYQRVADVCTEKLVQYNDEMAKQWLDIGITRKLAKKPVMTLPYGSTKQSCRESIEDYLSDVDQDYWVGHELFIAAGYLSNIMWESIGEVVIAARAAMTWLQKASRLLSKHNEFLQWNTPTGFKVYQGTMKMASTTVKTQLCGRLELKISNPTTKIDSYRQSNGVAPNFVHSMDASHLVKTVIEGFMRGVANWAMVHDSYGTYASDTAILARALRVSFCDLYADSSVLLDWKTEQEERTGIELPPLPTIGDLNVMQVMDAAYFFG